MCIRDRLDYIPDSNGEQQRLENENRQRKVQVEYLEEDLSRERGISAQLREGIGAVSYTHLDVYKRQAGAYVPAQPEMLERAEIFPYSADLE